MEIWIKHIEDFFSEPLPSQGYLINFPEYRPDLFKEMASHLGYSLGDFRAEKMAPLGTEATQLILDDLDAYLDGISDSTAAVVYNVEALLATKPIDEVMSWLEGFSGVERRHPLIVPLVLFGELFAQSHEGTFSLLEVSLPEQSLVSRLIH